jgi:hypothetical protein
MLSEKLSKLPEAVMLLTCAWEVPGCYLSRETDYPDWGFSWFSSVFIDICHYTSNYAVATFFHTLPIYSSLSSTQIEYSLEILYFNIISCVCAVHSTSPKYKDHKQGENAITYTYKVVVKLFHGHHIQDTTLLPDTRNTNK